MFLSLFIFFKCQGTHIFSLIFQKKYKLCSILLRNDSLHSVEHLSLLRRQEKFESLGNISGLLLLLSLKVFYKWRPTISFSNSLQSLEFKVLEGGTGGSSLSECGFRQVDFADTSSFFRIVSGSPRLQTTIWPALLLVLMTVSL